MVVAPSARPPPCCARTVRRSRCSPPGSSRPAPGSRRSTVHALASTLADGRCSRRCPAAATGWARCSSGWPGRSSNAPASSPPSRARSDRLLRARRPGGARRAARRRLGRVPAPGDRAAARADGQPGRAAGAGLARRLRQGRAGLPARRRGRDAGAAAVPGGGPAAARPAARLHAELDARAGSGATWPARRSSAGGRRSPRPSSTPCGRRSAGCRSPGPTRLFTADTVRRIGPDVAEAAGRAGTRLRRP